MDEKNNNCAAVDHEMIVGSCVCEDGEDDDEEELDFVESEEILNLVDEQYELVSKIDGKGNAGDDSGSPSRALSRLTYESSLHSYIDSGFPLSGDGILEECTDNRKKSGRQEEIPSQTEAGVALAVINANPTNDELSVKLTRWKAPTKLCCLCNLSEKSQLGQGRFFKVRKPNNFIEEKQSTELVHVPQIPRPRADEVIPAKKKKSALRHNANLKESTIDEHSYIGHVLKSNISDLFDEEGWLHIHLHCALFSREITRIAETELENVIPCVTKSLIKLCSYCNRFGANVTCAFNNCDKTYHFPCSATSAGFLHLKTYSFICSAHINHIPLLPTFNQVSCQKCDSLGDVSNLIMCSACGNHYHGMCLGRALPPEVRTGWQCSNCRSCQVCRESEESSKLMLCDTCDKAYHAACLRPVLTSIPKFGWKCQCCRVCNDCGSRTPGAGFSSRWHCHFTVCDSCYQQRNKGFSCPLCHRAYRAGSSKDMTQCTSCKKFVHGSCDPEAYPVTYQKNVEFCIDYQYVCPTCKNMHQFEKITWKKKDGGVEDTSVVDFNANTCQDLLASDDMEVDSNEKDEYNKFSRGAFGLGKGKPYTARKKIIFSATKSFKTTCKGKAAISGVSLYQKKNQKVVEFGKKKCGKTKIRGVFGVPSAGLQRPVSDSQNKSVSDNDNGENKIILCSIEEKFTLAQDVCAMCGALGTDREGCLISCVQCGQCYHPYCVNIKVTKIILQRGWRCLDCSVCEGCGQRTDESRLILCDDCDISFHIYCMEPKLDCVPRGTWKCKWCAQCLTCGANEPGVNCVWLKNYTECGPCASRLTCPSCQQPYNEGELIVKCENCERWLHGFCDQIRNGYDAEKCVVEGYSCVLCRPKDTPPPHLTAILQESLIYDSLKLKIRPLLPIKALEFTTTKDDTEHFIDGVHLSDNGLSQLTTLLNRIDTNVFSLRKKKRPTNTDQRLDQGILDSIESVISAAGVQDESPTSSSDIVYKEGMIVKPREDGTAPDAPEGFNIHTNETGVMMLRKKKRMRKIGVGGFNARNRTMKKESKTEDDCSEVSYYTDESYPSRSFNSSPDEKFKKKNSRIRKPKSKYAESYPSYIQDAFFGRELLHTASKDADSSLVDSGSDLEPFSSRKITSAATVTLSPDELEIMEKVNAIREEDEEEIAANTGELLVKMENDEGQGQKGDEPERARVDESIRDESKNETFKSILNMTDNLFDTIMNDGSRIKTESSLMDSLPAVVGKDVEEIFKNVLIDQMHDACETVLPEVNNNNAFFSRTFASNRSAVNLNSSVSNQQRAVQGNVLPSANLIPPPPPQPQPTPQLHTLPLSPATYPASSPYHSEYSNSPQFSPAFSEPPSPWIQEDSTPVVDSASATLCSSSQTSQKSSRKMEIDERLGENATICSVLHANINHPELKIEYPVWTDRSKQISKRWKALPSEQKQPFLSLARENRTKLMRVRKNPQETDKTIFSSQKIQESEREKHWKQMQALRQQKQQLPPLVQVQQQPQQHQLKPILQQLQIHDSREQTLQRIQPSQLQQGRIQPPMAGGNSSDNSNVPFCPSTNDKDQLQIATSPNVATLPSTTSPVRPQQIPFPRIASSRFPSSHVRQNYPSVRGPVVFSPSGSPGSPFYAADQNAQQMQNRPVRQRMPENDLLTAANNNPEMTRQLRELLLKQQIEKQGATCTDSGRQTLDMTNQPFVEKESADARPAFTNVLNQMYDHKQNATTTSRNFYLPWPVSSVIQRSQLSISPKTSPQQMMDPRLRLMMQQQQHSLSPKHQQQQQQQQHLQLLQRDQQQSSQLGQMQVQPRQTQQQTKLCTLAVGHMIKNPSSPSQFKPSSMQNVDAQLSGGPTQNVSEGNRMKEEFSQFNAKDGVISSEIALSNEKRSNFHANDTHTEGIPESVAADLDELERDGVVTGNMSEMSALFGDLMDDELLAEMGAGFNILEYTDPELDNFSSGDKTSILYDLVNNANEATKIKEENYANCCSGKSQCQVFDSSKMNTNSELENEAQSIEHSDLETRISKTENERNDKAINASDSTKRIRNEFIAQQNVSQHLHRVNLRDPGENNANNHLIKLNSPTCQTAQHPSPVGSHVSLTPISSTSLTPRPSSVVTPIPSPATPRSDIPVASPVTNEMQTQLASSTPLPPPPYPGPPPPYPFQSEQSMQQQIWYSNNLANTASSNSSDKIATNLSSQVPRGPLLLQEQPLLLEDLLEQEKKEQEKRNISPGNNSNATWTPLSDADFERLKADVLSSSTINTTINSQGQNIRSLMMAGNNIVQSDQQPNGSTNVFEAIQRQSQQQNKNTSVQSNDSSSSSTTATSATNSSAATKPETRDRISVFNVAHLRVPSEPPEKIVTERDQHLQQTYENWLVQQNDILLQQLKHYEGEMSRLRKIRKSLNSKQRGLKKQGTELTEHDSAELRRVTADVAALQKHLDGTRKLRKQHAAVIQEYKNKHPSWNSLPDGSDSSMSSGATTPVNVVSSSVVTVVSDEAASTTTAASSVQQMSAVSAVTSTSRCTSTSLCQAQTEEMTFLTNSNQQDAPQAKQSSTTTVASPINAGGLRGHEQIMRYSDSPVRFLPSPHPRPGIMAYQVHADGIRPSNIPTLSQGVRRTLQTQPFIVSAVTVAPTNSITTSTINLSQEKNAYQIVVDQNKEAARMQTVQQLTPEQHRLLLQHQFAQRTTLVPPTTEVDASAKRQKTLNQQKQAVLLQLNDIQLRLNNSNLSDSERLQLSQQKDALIKETKDLQRQAELTPQQKQQLAMVAHRQQFLIQQQQNSRLLLNQPKIEGRNVTSQPIQQHISLLQQSQQNHVIQSNQTIHQNQILQQQQQQQQEQQQQQSTLIQRNQLQPNMTSQNQIIQRNHMIPLSEMMLQQQQQQQPPPPPNFEQYNQLPQNQMMRKQDELTPQQAWMELGKTKLLPQEFEKYGIKGGLLGGSPMWNDKSKNNATAETENENTIPEQNEMELVPSTLSESASSASSQFYEIKEDAHSRAKEESTTDPTPNIAEDEMSSETPSIKPCRREDDSKVDTDALSSVGAGKSSSCAVENDEITLPATSDISKIENDESRDGCLDASKPTPSLNSLKVDEERGSEVENEYSNDTVSGAPMRTTSVLQTTATISSSTGEREPQSEEESSVINHSVVPAHAFHSYAKLVKNERNCQNAAVEEDMGDHAETMEQPKIENVDKPIDDENEKKEEMEKSKTPATETKKGSEPTKAIAASVVTKVGSTPRTTSVVQVLPTTSPSSPVKDSAVAVASQLPSRYTEYFHSYVKKLPRAEEESLPNEKSNSEKNASPPSSAVLLDGMSMKIKMENDDDAADGNVIVSRTLSEERLTCKSVVATTLDEVVTASPPCTFSTTFAAKDTNLATVAIAHSASSPSSKDGSHSPTHTIGGGMLPPRMRFNDDSQNVLLKQLLQNSGNASSLTPSTMTQHVTKSCQSPNNASPPPPSPLPPPPSSLPSSNSEITTIGNVVEPVVASISESSQIKSEMRMQFASNQNAIPMMTTMMKTTTIKQEGIANTCPKELVQVNRITQGQAVDATPAMSPTMRTDIKKETKTDDLVSSQSKVLDAGDASNTISGDSTSSVLDAQDLKKLKRRQYQAKRRQSQGKDHMAAIPKKRTRKVLKIDEDYDSFVDSLMTQLRQLPPLPITEPLLINNYAVCPPFGSGDSSKISLRTWTSGELNGNTFGHATVAAHDDHYNTEPFGDEEPRSPSAMPSTTRGFYNEEFSPLNLEADYEDRRLELARIDREADTPDSVMSSSSPECIIPHTPARFAGLRLIDENGSGVDSEEDEKLLKRISPVIPLVVPLALRPRVQYHTDADKENYGKSPFHIKSRHSSLTPLKDTGNLSVTLTLSSQAAQDIVGVLKNLATVLNITPPASYKISDRMPLPGRMNPFGNKFADDVEGVDLHKYLQRSVKRCQHCRIKINDCTWVKKKASEMPFVVQDGISEDLFFCSTSCYLQMILLVPPVISEHKVSSSDDSVSGVTPRKKMKIDRSNIYSLDGDVGHAHKVTHLRSKTGNGTGAGGPSYWEKIAPESTNKLNSMFAERSSLFKGIKYRTWTADSIPPPVQKFKTPTEKEITETLFRMGITVLPNKMPDDMRTCIFCQQVGDGVANGPSRLLNYDVDKWAHLNCSLWSDGVYETKNGALVNVDTALKQGLDITCTYCRRNGATLKCFKLRCSKVYHLSCAMKSGCWFFENKTVYCEEHLSKAESNRVLTTLAVYRRVYIDRDENRQIASVIKHAELTHLMRIGSLVFLNVGQLLPHQLHEFHNSNYIYPVGYKVIRFYWSMRIFNKRCQYVCTIHDVAGRPEFRVLVQEPEQDDLELRGSSPKAVWTRILEPLANLRKTNNSVQLYPRYVSGEDLFGLTEPAIVRILENLPGIETLSDYRFKYGRNPLLELPLAINPSGCARCEPRVRGPPLKRTHTQRTSSVMPRPVLTSSPLFSGDISCPYSKHFVHSKSSQYKKMKQEWRNYVYLARSKIQGLGLYAARDIDKHTMVIEYIGEIIRSQLSDFREKQYESKNRGVYMFRLDENRVVDATICGGLARYINHSCNPNCITEKVEVDREFRIIIFSKRRIVRGEELSYDYQFDIEDDSQKIPCLCGASNCRKWMN